MSGQESRGRWHKQFAKGSQYLCSAGAGGERAVDGFTRAGAQAGFAARAGARIPGRLMRAEEQHGAIGIKNVLRAVAVVYVPVRDQNAFRPVGALRMAGGDRHAIKEAEAHTARGAGVVPGWANDAECVAHLPGEDGVDSGEGAARG